MKKKKASKKQKVKKTRAKKTNLSSKLVATRKKQPTRKSVAGKLSKRSATKRSVSKRSATKRAVRKTQRSDDLKKIHGIGPVLEKRLHKNGITRFEQLAKLDHKGTVALASALGSSSYRIKRDAWAKRAAKLAKNRAT